MEASGAGSSCRLRLSLNLVGGFVFSGRDMPDRGVEPGGVESFHVLGGGQLDLRQVLPRAAPADQLGPIQADLRFHQRVLMRPLMRGGQ